MRWPCAGTAHGRWQACRALCKLGRIGGSSCKDLVSACSRAFHAGKPQERRAAQGSEWRHGPATLPNLKSAGGGHLGAARVVEAAREGALLAHLGNSTTTGVTTWQWSNPLATLRLNNRKPVIAMTVQTVRMLVLLCFPVRALLHTSSPSSVTQFRLLLRARLAATSRSRHTSVFPNIWHGRHSSCVRVALLSTYTRNCFSKSIRSH